MGDLSRAQAAPHRVPQPVVRGPLAEADLADQLRLDPDRVAGVRARQLAGERRRGPAQRREPSRQVVQHGVAEAGADVPDVVQAVWSGHPHQQRPDPAGAPALARPPSADHDLLRAHVLDLDPGPRPSTRFVARVPPLRDDAFQVPLAARRERRCAVAGEHRRHGDDARAVQLQPLEQLASGGVRQVDQVAARPGTAGRTPGTPPGPAPPARAPRRGRRRACAAAGGRSPGGPCGRGRPPRRPGSSARRRAGRPERLARGSCGRPRGRCASSAVRLPRPPT